MNQEMFYLKKTVYLHDGFCNGAHCTVSIAIYFILFILGIKFHTFKIDIKIITAV